MEKQRDKAARRVQRKADKLSGDSPIMPSDELGEPLEAGDPLEAVVPVPAVE
jgi:hypothetical protein